ncbi:MAG TPA: aromatic-ring-hydroxylating dioxygenase subunit beta [Stellaceae bacterium]|nr:aromatic-ring-hydroxylating dioxygenase subunit beta [Stellaceae bacterium]
MREDFAGTKLDPAEARALRLEIEEFHAAYCAALDEGRIADWPGFFTEDAVYRITGRDNADAGLPVGLIYCEGGGMLRDRALAIEKTAMFAPRFLLHAVSNVRVLGLSEGTVEAQATYLVLQTLVDEPTTIHQAGRYFDRFARVAGRLLLRERQCVYDTVLIDNSLVLPV